MVDARAATAKISDALIKARNWLTCSCNGGPRRRVRRLLVVLATWVLMVAGSLACASSDPAAHSPFDVTSPWRQTIANDPAVDPNSAAMIAAVQRKPALIANLVAYGIPIYEASPGAPTFGVVCTETQWGVCPFAGWPVVIPDAAKPNLGADGAMVTIDRAGGMIFEFWQAAKVNQQWSASWGAVNSLGGSGWGGAATGAGASRLGGVIRVAEIAAGVIPHALALQTANACPTFRAPAVKSDGRSGHKDCIPEGALLQLDPSIDLTNLGLTPGELAVATAMQRYGGYVMDRSGAPLSVSFELDTGAGHGNVGETYKSAGFRGDYDGMERVPWKKLRVLA